MFGGGGGGFRGGGRCWRVGVALCVFASRGVPWTSLCVWTSVCTRAYVRAVCVCNPAQVLESPAQLVSAVFSVLILTQNVARAFIHPVILYLADRATNSRTVFTAQRERRQRRGAKRRRRVWERALSWPVGSGVMELLDVRCNYR